MAQVPCPGCGAAMNRHAEKVVHPAEAAEVVDPALGGVVLETHTCPGCGRIASRRATQPQAATQS